MAADLDKLLADLDRNHGDDVDTRKYVILLPRHTGYMQVYYMMIDLRTRTILPKVKSIKWPRLTDLLDFSVCVLKNCIYVIGGREKISGRCVRRTLKYDPFLGRWRDGPLLKKARARHTSTVMGGKIYVVGGESTEGEILDSCEVYESVVNEWHKAPRLLGPRKDHACVAHDEKLYISGGTSKTETVNDNVWVYKKHWPHKSKPEKFFYDWFPFNDIHQRTMSVKVSKHNMILSRGKLFFINGITKNPSKDTISFTPSHNVAKSRKKRKVFITSSGLEAYKIPSRYSRDVKLSEINAKMTSSTEKVAMWNNKATDSQVLIIKREAPPQNSTTELPKRRWIKQLPHNPTARCAAETVLVGNKIYVFGGHAVENDMTSINSVQYYHCKKNKWVEAFSLGNTDFRDVTAAVIDVPLTSKDFQPVSYGDCKWVMW